MAFSQLPSSVRAPSAQHSAPHPPPFQPFSHAQTHAPSSGPLSSKPVFKPVFVHPPNNAVPPFQPPSGNVPSSSGISSRVEAQSEAEPRLPVPHSDFLSLPRSMQPPGQQAVVQFSFRPSPPLAPGKLGLAKTDPPALQPQAFSGFAKPQFCNPTAPSLGLPASQPPAFISFAKPQREQLCNSAAPPLGPQALQPPASSFPQPWREPNPAVYSLPQASPPPQCYFCNKPAQRLYTDVRCPSQCQVCVPCMVLILDRGECPVCLRVLSRIENDTIELYGLSLQDEE